MGKFGGSELPNSTLGGSEFEQAFGGSEANFGGSEANFGGSEANFGGGEAGRTL